MSTNALNNKDARKPKTTSTLSWVSDKLAAGAARVNGGEFQDIEVAVVKATNHDVVSPKEKHVRTLREVIATAQNRKKVVYMIHALYERLMAPNESWLVVLKTLMVFHKLMKTDREGAFKQEMIKYKEKRKLQNLLSLANFTDQTQKENWDFSAFVRVYSLYLEEKLIVFEQISFDVERDSGSDGIRFKSASSNELLTELPKIQKLLQRVMACVPEGNAARSDVVMESLKWSLTECFRLFRMISEGVITLAEHFFEMDRIDARKGLEMYKESVNSTAQMQSFFSSMQGLAVGQQIQFPQLQPPPEDFIEQMEEYVKGATGRTTTRKFPSILSRNARGGPSAAISAAGGPPNQKLEPPKIEEGIPEEKNEGAADLLSLDVLDLNDPVSVQSQNTNSVTLENPVLDPFADPVFGGGGAQNAVNTGPVLGTQNPVNTDPVLGTQTLVNTGLDFGAQNLVNTGPVLGTQNPVNTDPVFGGVQNPVNTDPVFGGIQNPVNTGPVFGGVQPPVNTGPAFGTQPPVNTGPVLGTQLPVNTGPVLGTQLPVNTGPVLGGLQNPVNAESGFLEDWNRPTTTVSSIPPQPVNVQEQGSSPFDDFFGGGVMAQPPPPPQTGPSPGLAFPMTTSNPFGADSGPPNQPLNFNTQYSAHGAQFTGPGAFADPFDSLNPALQKKPVSPPTGAPMRLENQDPVNPFGNNPTPPGQQNFSNFF